MELKEAVSNHQMGVVSYVQHEAIKGQKNLSKFILGEGGGSSLM